MKTALLLFIVSLSIVVFLSNKQSQLTYISYDLCQHKQLIDIAKKHQAVYLINEKFSAPAITITANQASLKKIQHEFDPVIHQSTHSPSPSHCHLTKIKYHAQYVNPKLTAFIPDDIDYISYAPPNIGQDKAVYCYYYFDKHQFNHAKSISKCTFIRRKDDRLITDDISDLERLNLQIMHHQGHQTFFNPFSHVYQWHHHSHLRYGITFHTKVNDWRYGYLDTY